MTAGAGIWFAVKVLVVTHKVLRPSALGPFVLQCEGGRAGGGSFGACEGSCAPSSRGRCRSPRARLDASWWHADDRAYGGGVRRFREHPRTRRGPGGAGGHSRWARG